MPGSPVVAEIPYIAPSERKRQAGPVKLFPIAVISLMGAPHVRERERIIQPEGIPLARKQLAKQDIGRMRKRHLADGRRETRRQPRRFNRGTNSRPANAAVA